MKNRLAKVIAACGVASRRKAEALIQEGSVTVNGQIERTPQAIVELGVDRIAVDGRELKNTEKKVVYLLNKPRGYVCSNDRSQAEHIVLDLFPPSEARRLFTVGRLDKETSGLLIVTNDGHFAQQLIHPSANFTKEYIVKTHQPIRDGQLKAIQRGLVIEGRFVKPVSVTELNRYTLEIVVKEGKKHEVRLFVEKAGLKVDQLKRTRIGPYSLGRLPIGVPKLMSPKELDRIRKTPK